MKHISRYVIFFLAVAVVVTVLLLMVPETVPVMNQCKDIIIIDAGHGGFDSGAIGRYSGVHEDILNLAVAKKLQKLFEDEGYTVVMTREDGDAVAATKDDDMWARRTIIDNTDADIVISIHMNKFQASSASGPVVFYFDGSDEGEKLAALIQEKMIAVLEPYKIRTHRPETYYILRSGKCPCVLVECGFLSNEREEWLLQTDDYQQKCAKAIFMGAVAYLDQRFVTDISEDIDQ
ncbi:MAG: N-acetylmuramoyl-L-alanine amidase [Eubacteriales bacterium]|nr:N-acetylmuramoyl-L-alanine amidase [Eubacteriales bacterium]